jgi:hypothetical protein
MASRSSLDVVGSSWRLSPLILAVLLGLAPWIARGDGLRRLSREEMDRARGGNQMLAAGMVLCDKLQGNAACNGPGDCLTCETAYYSDTSMNQGTNNKGGGDGQSCGRLMNGSCTRASISGGWSCYIGTATGNNCMTPPNKPTPQ